MSRQKWKPTDSTQAQPNASDMGADNRKRRGPNLRAIYFSEHARQQANLRVSRQDRFTPRASMSD